MGSCSLNERGHHHCLNLKETISITHSEHFPLNGPVSLLPIIHTVVRATVFPLKEDLTTSLLLSLTSVKPIFHTEDNSFPNTNLPVPLSLPDGFCRSRRLVHKAYSLHDQGQAHSLFCVSYSMTLSMCPPPPNQGSTPLPEVGHETSPPPSVIGTKGRERAEHIVSV